MGTLFGDRAARTYVLRCTRCMPHLLESGKLRLSPKEANSYCGAANRLHEEQAKAPRC